MIEYIHIMNTININIYKHYTYICIIYIYMYVYIYTLYTYTHKRSSIDPTLGGWKTIFSKKKNSPGAARE